MPPAPRIAFMHTWLGTQTEGWWREAFDKLHVPYDYISTQTVAHNADLRSKYDVIIFAPVGRGVDAADRQRHADVGQRRCRGRRPTSRPTWAGSTPPPTCGPGLPSPGSIT